MLAGGPVPSPFFAPPPPPRSHSRTAALTNKENVTSPIRHRAPPFPRPESPLPALPPSTSQHIRTPAKSSSYSPFPAPPTTLTSLAAFKAHHAASGSLGGGSSEDTHRTTSDVDLDLSFERDSRNGHSLLDDPLVEEGLAGEEEQETIVYDGLRPDWVGIAVRPAEHDVPESHLVRSDSGKLVGARHGRASSAVDLRAQFKAAARAEREAETRADVAITMEPTEEDSVDELRRQQVREGKRPAEGERAMSTSLWIHDDVAAVVNGYPEAPKAIHRRSVGRGFAYHPTGSIAQAPRSAPPQFQPTFANQQDLPALPRDPELEQAKQNRAFPLPLRLIDRTKAVASTFASRSPKTSQATTATFAFDSDVESVGASPLFDDLEGTVRTAPSTPNDTPLMQDCFDEDDMAPPVPVPHHLGSSAHPPPLPLAGLGFDFGSGAGIDDFPTIPLRQSRRISLPPADVARRRFLRLGHTVVPSFSVSPPPAERPSVDETIETDLSSRSNSQDSIADPTASPSRRLSRRLSTGVATAAHPQPTRQLSVHFEASSDLTTSDTPERDDGPSVRTPQHLLVTPTPTRGRLARSFSFSPAPLRLVKAQLLRAAGYSIAEPSPPVTPTTAQQHDQLVEADPTLASPASSIRTAGRRKTVVWDDLADLLSSSPATWLDEVVPAKLAFIVRFRSPFFLLSRRNTDPRPTSLPPSLTTQAGFLLGPWCWILGGWWLRSLDGELLATRGKRCRDPVCGCSRVLRGSALQDHTAASTAFSKERARMLNPHEEEMWAGLDKWVFWNRVASVGGGVGITVIVAVAVWAAAAA